MKHLFQWMRQHTLPTFARVVMCLSTLIMSAAHATGASQPVQKVTLDLVEATLKTAFQQIEKQTDCAFIYADDVSQMVVSHKVTLSIQGQPLTKALEKLLEGSGLTYDIKGRQITIQKSSKTGTAETHAPNKSTVVSGTITGTVYDAKTKQPIIGATVWLKDSAVGAITDTNGEYSLKGMADKDYLSVSFIGFKTVAKRISSNVMNFDLQPEDKEIEEVVVTGYASQKKASVVGAITTIPVNNIKMPTAKLSSNLAGQLAGIISVQRSGEPGAGSTFWIRGVSTFGANAYPLVLVDGIERDMDLVDYEDIKEFSILKDAAASALYGVRGANGVVLITTRSGEEGKPTISLKVETGIISPTQVPKMADANQWADMYNKAWLSETNTEFYSPEQFAIIRNGSDPDLYPNVNWMNELYKDISSNQRVNVNVSGGNSVAKYYISGGFYNEDGLFKVDGMNDYNTSVFYRRYNFRANVDVKLTRTTNLNVNLSTAFEHKNEPGTDGSTIWSYALRTSPNAFPIYYSTGELAGPPAKQGYNPYALLTQSGYKVRFNNTAQSLFSLNQNLDVLTKGLSATVKYSFDARNANNISRLKTPTTYLGTRDQDGNLITTVGVNGTESLDYSQSSAGYRTAYLEGQINYSRSFGGHSVGGLLLYQQSKRNKIGTDASTSEYALPYCNQGVAGRVTYSYDNRYFIEGNFGYNGSENFAKGNRFGFFPSVAAGYAVSEEPFWKPLKPYVDLLKIRGSFGLVGNDQIAGNRRFIYMSTMKSFTTGFPVFGTTPAYENARLAMGEWGNEDLTWETSKKLNIGVDISLLNSIRISADYFKERRTGILLERASIPYFVGLLDAPYSSIGKMRNSGIDGSLDINRRVGQVDVTLRGTFTYARNIIENMDEAQQEYVYQMGTGQSRYQQLGYVSAGLFQNQADIDAWPKQMLGGDNKPGDIKYRDLNGDGVVNTYDRKPIGYTNTPEIVYGFGLSLRWKGIDVAAFFQGVGNVSFLTNTAQLLPFSGASAVASSVFADLYGNYWSESNPNAKYPRLTTSANLNNNAASTFWMANGNYLRLKNLEIGYTFPKKIVSKIYSTGIRIYFQGNNLLTLSDFKLWDPALQTGATSYPTNKVYNIGLSLTF